MGWNDSNTVMTVFTLLVFNAAAIGPFFLTGASLFLPYSVNQLRETFKSNT